MEENVYDAAGQRGMRRSPGRETIFIDNVYEVDHSETRRHIPLGSTIVATITTPGQARLITDSMLSPFIADNVDGADGADGRLACSAAPFGHVGGWSLAPIGALLVGLGWYRRRWLSKATRGGRAALAASGRRFRKQPIRWLLSIMLVAVHLLQTNSVALAGDSRAASPHREQRFYYHSDNVGNTNVITDDSGVEAERRHYAPFGEQISPLAVEANDRLHSEISFNGHELDQARDVALYYFGARFYDPVQGRFLTPDSVVPSGSPQALHRYEFNLNNPIRFIDVTGHTFLDVLAGVLVVLAVIGAGILTGGLIFGLAATLSVLLLPAIGAVVGGIVALALAAGSHPILSSFTDGLSLTLIGALIGASAAGAVAEAPAAFGAKATFLGKLAFGALAGAAVGGAGGTALALRGGRPDLMLAAFLVGAIAGAAAGTLTPFYLQASIAAAGTAEGTLATIVAVAKVVAGIYSAGSFVFTAGWETATLISDSLKQYKLSDRELTIDLLAFLITAGISVGLPVPGGLSQGESSGSQPAPSLKRDPTSSGLDAFQIFLMAL